MQGLRAINRLMGVLLCATVFLQGVAHAQSASLPVIAEPQQGQTYHGAYVSSWGGEDKVSLDQIRSYQQQAGKTVAWIYFSHEWANGRAFPTQTANLIQGTGAIPFIRLMMRSNPAGQSNSADPVYTLDQINRGAFDKDLTAWGKAAKAYGKPLIVEYGTEVNGSWFPWNGQWNGAGAPVNGSPKNYLGPYRFRQAYRRIVQIVRAQGASNIKWVFHVNYVDLPNETWNYFENYYPGDDVVDWLAVSIYGPQKPNDTYWNEFRTMMDSSYPRLTKLANKPIVVAEFGVAKNNPLGKQEDWANRALLDVITNSRWPKVIGFAWFNNHWMNGTDPANNTYMMLEENPELARVFRARVGASAKVLGRPIIRQ